MSLAPPLLCAVGVAVAVRAGGGGAQAELRVLRPQHATINGGALLTVVGGSPTARLAVLEVLSGRRAPTAGTITRAVPEAGLLRQVVSVATGVLLARSWAHLPGAARAGRARGAHRRASGGGQLHLLLADGEAPADRRIVARLVEGARAGDGIVLALPLTLGLPAAALRGWRLDGDARVAALSRAS
jgi:hypothetical protein